MNLYLYVYVCVYIYMLAPTLTIWINTRLQRVIAVENSTACEEHESTRCTGAKNVILLPENVNRLMGL